MSTRGLSTSIPVVLKPLSAKTQASGRPTYPIPTTATFSFAIGGRNVTIVLRIPTRTYDDEPKSSWNNYHNVDNRTHESTQPRRRVVTSIGVYILSYNRPHFLREALNSVFMQQRKADKIFILDNGSDPGVKESIAAELDKGVIWVGADHNHSSTWNHNRVLELAREDLFYLMHDDDRLLPDFISTQVDFMDRNPEVIASGCNGFRIGPNGKRDGRYVREKGEQGSRVYPDSASMADLYSRSYIPFPIDRVSERVSSEGRIRGDSMASSSDAVFLVRLAGIRPDRFPGRGADGIPDAFRTGLQCPQ